MNLVPPTFQGNFLSCAVAEWLMHQTSKVWLWYLTFRILLTLNQIWFKLWRFFSKIDHFTVLPDWSINTWYYLVKFLSNFWCFKKGISNNYLRTTNGLKIRTCKNINKINFICCFQEWRKETFLHFLIYKRSKRAR